MSYSQSKEDKKILRYFNGRTGTLLEIGANDGSFLSNSKLLIENDWSAHLVEPSTVFKDLKKLHKENKNVKCYNIGIGTKNEKVKFFESGNHVPNGTDKALVSSVKFEETKRWRDAGVEFTEREVELKTFKDFWEEIGKPQLNFISTDTEGYDWDILQQIDLKEVGCECLIIEWNGDKDLEKKFTSYCGKFGLKETHRNAENIIYSITP